MPKWIPSELRAIAEGRQAAETSGVVPSGLDGSARTSWVEGWARGWNGLGSSHTSEGNDKADFKVGWAAGHKVGKAEAKGYRVSGDRLNKTLALLQTPWAAWPLAARDAYDDGVACALNRLISIPRLRFRGRLIEHDATWYYGWEDGLDQLTSKPPRIIRHPVTDKQTANDAELSVKKVSRSKPRPPKAVDRTHDLITQSLGDAAATLPPKMARAASKLPRPSSSIATKLGIHESGEKSLSAEAPARTKTRARRVARHLATQDSRSPPISVPAQKVALVAPAPKTAVERQRAYRARRSIKSIEISIKTHELLMKVCEKQGVGIDEALGDLLFAELQGAERDGLERRVE